MINNLPFVSIIIPCRNEEKFISSCLDSIINQDFPKQRLEVLVVDGMSEDKTREIIKKFKIQLIDNPQKYTPYGLNIGIRKAKGEIIIRMDAHAVYSKDYVSKSIRYLKEYNADNVGGVIKTLPRENKIIAKAIALSLSSLFGAGSSYFRIGVEKPKWVDTVFGGCYKREVFDRIGLFNENLIRTQDLEFNLRLKRRGGKILLVPDIVSYYYPKANLKDFFLGNIKDGFWAIYPLKFVRLPLCLRHYIPFVFVLSLIGTGFLGIFSSFFYNLFLFIICLYVLASVYFSNKIAAKEKDARLLFLLPVVFASRHFGYGFGSAFGLIKLLRYGTKKAKRN